MRVGGPAARWTIAVVAAMLVFAVVASFLVVGRHRDYRTYRNDTGNMVQVVDNTAHGRILVMTGGDGRQISRLAAHVNRSSPSSRCRGWSGQTRRCS